MKFWEVRFKHTIEDNEGYPLQKNEEPNYFETVEECMAFVLSQPHLNITDIEFHQRNLGSWKTTITLNPPHKAV